MTVTLNELLMLAGRLDDSSGFDTPRERFRRFLVEHVTDAHAARTLIEQCQHSPGDQHHHALQDLVVVLGRCLGFETRYGSHLPAAGSLKADGHWRSRRLDVVLEIRTDQTEATSFEALSRSMAAFSANSQPAKAGRALGLCVLTPLYAGRGRLEEIQGSQTPDSRVRLVTLRSLLTVADMIGAGRLTHDDLVRLLGSDLEFDFAAELLERAANPASPAHPAIPHAARFEVHADTGFWLATVGADQGATPEQFVEIVIGRRRIFGISEGAAPPNTPQQGDGICFYVPGRGVVGHGHVRSAAEGGIGLRDAHRFSLLLQLQDVVLYLHAPSPLEEEMQLRVRAARLSRDRSAHSVIRISRQEFDRLMTIHEAEERRAGDSAKVVSPPAPTESTDAAEWQRPQSEGRSPDLAVSAGDSRSHE